MSHEEDWDLFAIVRSCKAANNTAQTPQETSSSSNSFMSSSSTTCLATTEQNDGPFSSNNFAQPSWTNGFQELNQLLNTFNPTITTATTTSAHGINPNNNPHPPFPHFTAPSNIGASTSGFDDRFHQQQQKQYNQLQVQVPQTSTTALALLPSSESQSQIQTPRSRKRKSQQKKLVCHVTADNLSSDLWAWRKYGQKPIKGSPYPRNYYRCSSCKGCAARKQVERSLSDPTMFVVTYTGEHKHAKPAHRNSLAGSTRKPTSTTSRLPEIQESTDTTNKNPDEKSHENSTTTKYQNAKPEQPEIIEQEMEDSSSEDDSGDDGGVLIPNNTATMSDAVFLGSSGTAASMWHYDGGFENSSDPDGSTNQN
ncbi:hypothetical protein PIB30_064246 [Stylosanthes scabra]|uniref:WRKY domain-containing protein n=1 Tax=Stylosanthes scabra TaxID=79078 RepID=A0ABU6VP16_9FABA|nr:hypothetical protein [Stylosanthes scabra]